MAMNISVFGLGFVGCVSAACLARLGHRVVGVDVKPLKVGLLRSGQSTIVEAEIAEIVNQAVCAGALTATESAAEAIDRTELSLVCVGTPSRENGSLDLAYIESSCHSIGQALAHKKDRHAVV